MLSLYLCDSFACPFYVLDQLSLIFRTGSFPVTLSYISGSSFLYNHRFVDFRISCLSPL